VAAYIVRRLLLAVIVLLMTTVIVFLGMHLLPGDPILLKMTQSEVRQTSPEQIAYLRHQFGLDKPLIVQYFDWLSGVVHGDFGVSILYQDKVTNSLKQSIPITAHIGALAEFGGFIIGIPLGVICAVRRGKWLDTLITITANLGITVPIFWLGILLMYLFALELRWLPVFGYTSPFDNFWLSTKQLIMPVFCLAVFPLAAIMRQTRSSMLEVMRQDYIRTAWSKGLTERKVVIKHAMKNGLIPVLTFVGLGITNIIGGSVLIETVFNIPGMGRLLVYSILNQDYPVTQGITLIIAVVVVVVNLLVDISYGWLDPRIRYN
jgi:peptide/nickel transport system permease protein